MQPGDFLVDDGELTLGDLEDAELALGAPLDEATKSGEPGMRWRLAAVLIWIRRRRIDPGFTLEAARNLPASMLAAVLAASEPPGEP